MHDSKEAISGPDLEDETLLSDEDILVVIHHVLVSLLVKAVRDEVQGNADENEHEAEQHRLDLDQLILQVEGKHVLPVSGLVEGELLDVAIEKEQDEERPVVKLPQPKGD